MAVPPDLVSLRKIEKELVAEQPGFVIGLAGVVIAVFMGLALRAAISSERILNLVDSAAAKIDPRVTTHVGSAQISLADGIFPELAVVVRDIAFESNEVCWMRPTMEVDELKLPVDIWHLLQGEVAIHEILAHEVSLSLRTDMSKCAPQTAAAERSTSSEPTKQAPQAAIQPHAPTAIQPVKAIQASEKAWEQLAKSKNSVDSLRVERVTVHYLPKLFTSFEIRQMQVDLKSVQPRTLEASGLLHLNGETLSGDYSSTAALKLDFNEQRNPMWQAQVEGHWREGNYDLQAYFQPQEQELKVNFDMKQIPVNQLLPLLHKYHVLNGEFNAKQTWLTTKGHVGGKLTNPNGVPVEFELIRVEGAVGEFQTENLQIQKLSPLEFSPFNVDIKSLQLDGLLAFLEGSKLSPILGHLGTVHGLMAVQDPQHLKLKGQLSGLEVVFSGQGVRQIQSISVMEGEIALNRDKWIVHVDRIRPAEGIFLGDLNLEANTSWSAVQIRAKIDELGLGPQVQKILTRGGQIGSINGEVFAKMDQARLSDLRGHLGVADLAVADLTLKKAKALFTTRGDNVVVDLRAQGITAGEGSEPYKFLRLLMIPKENTAFDFTTAGVIVRTHLLRDMAWDDLKLQTEKQSLHSRGGWNEAGALYGDIQVLDQAGRHNFKIEGDRDRPSINAVTK